jgi:nucleoside-diphosphate-sugar epimerase
VKLLLTGATGFIGSHIARALVRAGHEVHALVLPNDDPWRIRDLLPSLPMIQADILDPSFAPPPTRFDLCLHLAWYVVPGKYLEAPENRDFLRASVAFASAMARAGCPRFVATGTCFEYDTHLGLLSESSPTNPRSLYANCKLQLFHELQALGAATGMGIAWPRFFYQYGPGEDPRRFVPVVINNLLRGEPFTVPPNEQTRDYLHVADVASAVCAVARSRLTGAVNIGSGEPTSVRQMTTQIAAIIGRPDLIKVGTQPYAPDDSPRIIADNTRLREQTDWVRRYPLDAGLRDAIDWWKTRLLTR